MIDLYDKETDHLPTINSDELSDEQVIVELEKIKSELAHEVVILGHHYQQDDVIRFADYTGDSLQLAKVAAKLDKKFILFCGVHFMAETADMLTSHDQHVILPDLRAGCSMADMANGKDIERAWAYIKQATDDLITPITYINCSAELKAFVGKHQGSICTSSNAEKVITWALNQGGKLLFFPDQHLGRNTCQKLGIQLDQMVVYNPTLLNGGLTREEIAKAKVILWYGYCSVHQGFKLEHIERLRKNSPQMKIIVHPECPYDVVQASDLNGSTSYIIDTINQSAAGSQWAVGTEINLVSRLANAHPDKKIISLSPYQCLCTTMYRVRPRWLLESMRSIKRGNPINIIKVTPEITNFALKALDRMLQIS
jgi:quinolinate synthase